MTNPATHERFSEPHYCAHCHAAVEADAKACEACRSPFTGAGRFDVISGVPPAGCFRDLFPRMGTSRAHVSN